MNFFAHVWCRLWTGHRDAMLKRESERLTYHCSCGYIGRGWTMEKKEFTRVLSQ